MKTWWSVAEACVWAATRDLEAVAAVPPGATLSQLGPLGRAAGKGALPSVQAAAEALPGLCRRGEIDIQGRQILKADTKPIPAPLWQRLCLRHEILWTGPGRNIRREVLIAASPGVFSPRSIWWGDLVVRRADAVRVWPPQLQKSGVRLAHLLDAALGNSDIESGKGPVTAGLP
jgi:hypothetical protein